MYLKLYTLYAARLNQSALQMAWGAYGLVYRNHIQKAVPLTVVGVGHSCSLYKMCFTTETTYVQGIITGRMTHICVSTLTIIGTNNGFSPGGCQSIIWAMLECCWFEHVKGQLSKIYFHSRKFIWKWRQFYLGLNELRGTKYHHIDTSSLPIMLSARHSSICGISWVWSQVNVKMYYLGNLVPFDSIPPAINHRKHQVILKQCSWYKQNKSNCHFKQRTVF